MFILFQKLTNLVKQRCKKSFNWINLRPMFCSDKKSKQNKNDHQLYLLQEIRRKHFLRTNEVNFNQNIH